MTKSHNYDSNLYLVLEASTSEPSIALVQLNRVLASSKPQTRDPITGERFEPLAPEIQKLFSQAAVSPAQLSGVVCASGPGGFTSLRGAAAIAKGMCSALSIPLFAVPSPVLVVASASQLSERFTVAQDAGRNESYVSVVEIRDDVPVVTGNVHIIENQLLQQFSENVNATLLDTNSITFTSLNLAECVAVILLSIQSGDPSASGGMVDLNQWEPTYGRLAEAQVKWEAQHGVKLPV